MSQEVTLSSQLNSLSLMYQLQSVLITMQKNINLIASGANGKIVTVNGGSLFALAAKYYGDATLWTSIANANGLTDPQLPTNMPISLIVPQTTTNTGGVIGI